MIVQILDYNEATCRDDITILQHLWDKGERFDKIDSQVTCSIPGGRRIVKPIPSSLTVAIKARSFKALRWLLEHGADYRRICPQEKVDAVTLAWRDVEALEVLKDFSESARRRWMKLAFQKRKL